MATGVTLFLVVCVVAVCGYVASGWKLDDSIYMVVITIFGVGYGEVQPVQSPPLRALTIMVIVVGYGAVIYTVGGFMQMLIDGELNRALGARRMTKGIERLRQHTIVCGVGRMGTILCRELHAAGRSFVVIDTNEQRLQDAEDQGYLVMHGDATEEHILDQAGIDRATTLATVLSDDATNVFVTITAREMNPHITIIARGENPRTERKLIGCGANKVILPTAIGASKVAQLIIRPSADSVLRQLSEERWLNEELAHIGLQFDEVVIAESSPWVNKALRDVEVRSRLGCLIVGIRRPDGSMLSNPPADTQLVAQDTLIVLGRENDALQLAARHNAPSPRITYRGVSSEP